MRINVWSKIIFEKHECFFIEMQGVVNVKLSKIDQTCKKNKQAILFMLESARERFYQRMVLMV
jgi:hypothetical protein